MQLVYNPAHLEVVPAETFITQDDKPKEALQSKARNSIALAAQLVVEKKADAMVSAGNTGAVILAAAQQFNRLVGVRRTALAAVYPTEQKHGPKGDPFALMLDVGATLHVNAYDLATFAVMGAAYARVISSNTSPKVALLSNGREASKGAPEVVEAHRILSQNSAINFMGNVSLSI